MALYRFIVWFVWLLALLRLSVRVQLANLTFRDPPSAERLLPPPRRTTSAPLVWLHGASNGELTSARPMAEAILSRWPNAELLITTNTPTARAMTTGWNLPRTSVRLAPLDAGPPLRAFLDRLRPSVLLALENELWPLRLTECARRGVPVLVAGARISDRSARRWGRLPGIIGPTLAAIRWLAPQDAASGERFLSLGLAPDRIGPVMVLKALASQSPTETPDLPFPRAATLLAASTHEGEEETVLAAFATLLRDRPGARLILAPRHPRRSAEVAALIARQGLSFATRSLNQPVTAETQVYLADTMGEMALWYQAAGLTFVGGSLADRGGHTPFEPAAFGSAILHGANVANFAAPYHALDTGGGAVGVKDAADLAAALAPLLGDPAAQTKLTDLARIALGQFGAEDPMAPFLSALDRLVPGLKSGL